MSITRYEVAILRNGKLVEVIGYSERFTKAVLIKMAQSNAAKIKAVATDTDLDQDWTYTRGTLRFGAVAVTYLGTEKNPS